MKTEKIFYKKNILIIIKVFKYFIFRYFTKKKISRKQILIFFTLFEQFFEIEKNTFIQLTSNQNISTNTNLSPNLNKMDHKQSPCVCGASGDPGDDPDDSDGSDDPDDPDDYFIILLMKIMIILSIIYFFNTYNKEIFLWLWQKLLGETVIERLVADYGSYAAYDLLELDDDFILNWKDWLHLLKRIFFKTRVLNPNDFAPSLTKPKDPPDHYDFKF